MDELTRAAELSPARAVGMTEVTRVRIGELVAADSPRAAGEDQQHARMLAESDAELPPIIVHRQSMRVIDGMHRLRAAILRGETELDVRFYDGDEKDAFVLAVRANVAHGLPLSLNDRIAAARRIIGSHPHWSDRMIASVTGLAPKTVGGVRTRSSEEFTQSNVRLGKDGRTRPTNTAAGRLLASELLRENPAASLREIARAAGVAPSTVSDVRERLSRGKHPVPPRQRGALAIESDEHEPDPAEPRSESQTSRADRIAMLEALRKDPSFRFTEAGRALLRWLDSRFAETPEWERLVEGVPSHRARTVADLIHDISRDLSRFAELIERKGNAGA
ncbi:ParB N-terminal domain-containing protein [Amycolatopsis minnesotensis]|uniref:ParB N-terminal domain-containing protein n=1 Tax=Amycolatopsis minnesotensis TaxID=337894 RepID=A0ABP5DAK0_9PSEU